VRLVVLLLCIIIIIILCFFSFFSFAEGSFFLFSALLRQRAGALPLHPASFEKLDQTFTNTPRQLC